MYQGAIMIEEDDIQEVLTKWEAPMKKIIPRVLYEAQQSDLTLLSDSDLIAAAQPDSLDWRLRIRYNSLLARILDPSVALMDKVIRIENIIDGLCGYDIWNRRCKIPAKAVFYSRKIGTYLEDQDALLTAMSARLWEIASAPLLKENGKLDMQAATIVHKTIQILLDRKFGQAIQRQVTASIDPVHMDPMRIEADINKLEALANGLEKT
jgi:hypothetical protein